MVRYGFVRNRVFYSFPTLNECRKALNSIYLFKKQDEYEIVKCNVRHIPNRYDPADVLVGFVYADALTGNTVRYRPKDSRKTYLIASDGSLKRSGSYEVIF